ncbi:MAG: Lrp/AsnC ligand binding domain-containing protein [Candidatus Diapherotrites archaeon]|nr:Lrp/AsnC ligand binding domain-containing protein [Candidatus Diapherotrites archaeon]
MTVSAYVLLKLAMGTANDVVVKLNGMEEIAEVSLVYGHHDAIIKVNAKDLEGLKQFVLSLPQKIPHVRDTQTLIQA